MNQPTLEPTRKVTAGALGGAGATIIQAALIYFADIELPAEVVAAIAVLAGFVTSYFTNEREA